MADVPGRLQQGTSFDQAMPMLNGILDSIDAENRTKIIKNNGVNKVLFGYQHGGFGSGDYGLKIAKDGIDVTSAAETDLVFNSAFNTFKIVASDTISFTKPASQTSFTQYVTHSLGYAPIVLAFSVATAFDGTLYSSPFDGISVNTTTGIVDTLNSTLATSLDIQFTQRTPSAGANYSFAIINTVKYYLLRETSV